KIQLVDNPKRIIPAGVNVAMMASVGEIIVRMDAHSIPQNDYVARCVAGLEAGLGDNVGGRWDIMPSGTTWIAKSISLAAAHPIGVGDAQYRHSDTAAAVDTVPYGSFYRALLDKVGLFDEMLIANEDYEFNTRIRQSGGTIWFDPQIRCQYFARPNLSRLAKQYWTYGFWKFKMLQRYPSTIRWRQFLPPAFLLGLIFLAVLSIFFKPAVYALAAVLGIYLLVLLLVGLSQGIKEKNIALVLGVPLAIATMHFSWAAGFIASIFKK
ncbi:MAG TPA: glycosyltransferase family 2 protein, partial [Anaerolineaceae bacterium]|nr:glycosyltransferase family 2 protein [Anaerolineaceae bacterium]